MTEQSERQRRETERMETVIEHTEMVGNRRECHGKAGERWRRSMKIRYMTLNLNKFEHRDKMKHLINNKFSSWM